MGVRSVESLSLPSVDSGPANCGRLGPPHRPEPVGRAFKRAKADVYNVGRLVGLHQCIFQQHPSRVDVSNAQAGSSQSRDRPGELGSRFDVQSMSERIQRGT